MGISCILNMSQRQQKPPWISRRWSSCRLPIFQISISIPFFHCKFQFHFFSANSNFRVLSSPSHSTELKCRRLLAERIQKRNAASKMWRDPAGQTPGQAAGQNPRTRRYLYNLPARLWRRLGTSFVWSETEVEAQRGVTNFKFATSRFSGLSCRSRNRGSVQNDDRS